MMTSTAKIKLSIGVIFLAIIGIIFASLYPFDKVQAPETPIQGEIKNANFVPNCDESTGEQCALSNFPREISREEAKNLILEGKVISVFQAHSLQVRLTTDEGQFSVTEPKIDEVFEVIKQCGTDCDKMELATE